MIYNVFGGITMNKKIEEQETAFFWGLLGFLIPILGFLLWMIWYKTKPKASKAAGIGVLISLGLLIILTVLMYGFH